MKPSLARVVSLYIPQRRKLFALLLGLLVLVIGCLLVISACVLKIVERRNAVGDAPYVFMANNSTVVFADGLTTEKDNTASGDIASYVDYFRQANLLNTTLRDSSARYSNNTNENISRMLELPISIPSSLFPRGEDSKVPEKVRGAVFEKKYNTTDWQSYPTSATRLSYEKDNDVERLMSLPQTKEDYIPLTGILGILGYICLDIGFDLGNPMCRAFILEHSPSSQHTHLLFTATQIASLAGLFMSSLGVFNLPGVIETIFGVDGTSGTFIFMLTVIFTIVVSFFGCSIWTGMSLKKAASFAKAIESDHSKRYTRPSGSEYNSESRKIYNNGSSLARQEANGVDAPENHYKNGHKSSLKITRSSEYVREEEKMADEKSPLLLKQNQSGIYKSVSLSVASIADIHCKSALSHPKPSGPPETHALLQSHSILEGIPEHPKPSSASSKSFLPSESKICNPRATNAVSASKDFKSSGIHVEDEFHHRIEESLSTPFSLSNLEASLSVSSDGERVGTLHRSFAQIEEKDTSRFQAVNSSSSPEKASLFNKRLVILVISTAFSVSSLLCMVMYSSNAVTLGIYGADPTAELGTAENLSYRRGLRTAAMGNVVFYMAYFLSCVLNNKSYKVFGELFSLHFAIHFRAILLHTG